MAPFQHFTVYITCTHVHMYTIHPMLYYIRSMSIPRSVDSLTRDMSNGLKLTEQQNFNIDANRLSTTLSIFDPLSESSSDPTPEDSGVEVVSGQSGDSDVVFSPPVIQGNGAKPRDMSQGTPRISVHQVN